MATESAQNPLLEPCFRIPFDRIGADHVVPAADALIAETRRAIEAIGATEGTPTWETSLGALERATERIEWAMGIVGHLEAVATSDPLREAYNEARPKVSALWAAIPLDPGLYRVIKAFAASDEAKTLDPTQARFLQKTLDDFRRHGAELDEAGKERLQGIAVELAEKTTKFSQNVLDATNDYELVLSDEAELAGLPHSAIEAAAAAAAEKEREGWRFTLQEPSVVPVLTYLDDADIRRDMWRAYNRRASEGQFANPEIIERVIELRQEQATLLGYESFSDLVLEDRMAHDGTRARAFVNDLRERAKAAFSAETEDLHAFRRELEGPEAQRPAPWDVAYYAEKQRQARYDFDEEALRPYFPLEKVLDGLFEIAHRLYGVRVVPVDDMPTWHDEVRTYALEDADGTRLGCFYADLHPREEKRGGAWMNDLMTGAPARGRPHLGLICGNMSKPVGDRPALLRHREVETIFHEFGHLLHHLLTRVEIRSLAGANVAWDFVELPSQIMENWCWEREALDLFARHWESDAPIPNELFDAMQRARKFRGASATMRQLGFASVDLGLHLDWVRARKPSLLEYARDTAAKFSAAELPEDYAMICGFGHLFAGPVAYASGYYSYKWAEVLDADAFTAFAKGGIFSREVGRRFREQILERGNSADPAALYRDFMGRDPELDALLVRTGLVEAEG